MTTPKTITLTLPYTEEPALFHDGWCSVSARGIETVRNGTARRIAAADIEAAVRASWEAPASDYAARMAAIEAAIPSRPLVAWHDSVGPYGWSVCTTDADGLGEDALAEQCGEADAKRLALLANAVAPLCAERRAASAALAAAGIPDDGRPPAERISDLAQGRRQDLADLPAMGANDEPTSEDLARGGAAIARMGTKEATIARLVAKDPALRAAFDASPAKIRVLPVPEYPLRPEAARMRERLNTDPDLCLADAPISVADLARALLISEEDMRAIEAGKKTTDAAGWEEIQTACFLLGSGTKAEHIADPASSPAFQRAMEREDEGTTLACRGCGAPCEVDPGTTAHLCAECTGEGKTHEMLDGPQTEEDRAAVQREIARSYVDEEEAWARVLEEREEARVRAKRAEDFEWAMKGPHDTAPGYDCRACSRAHGRATPCTIRIKLGHQPCADEPRAPLSMILAVARSGVIGKNGKVPWDRLPEDLKHFKAITMGRPLIVGRKTAASLPPLPGRSLVVLSHAGMAYGFTRTADTIEGAIALAREAYPHPVVIGGAEVYRAALPLVTRIYLTEIDRDVDGDTVFHLDRTGWREVSRRAGETPGVSFVVLERETLAPRLRAAIPPPDAAVDEPAIGDEPGGAS